MKRIILIILLFVISCVSLSAFATNNTNYVKINLPCNIRSGPSTYNSIIGHADYGAKYKYIGEVNDWYIIEFDDTIQGYISKERCTYVGERITTTQATTTVAPTKTVQPNVTPQITNTVAVDESINSELAVVLKTFGIVIAILIFGGLIIKCINSPLRGNSIPIVQTPTDYEHYVARYLANHGYKHVSVTQASHDYGADIIAYDEDGQKTCIQCKMYKGSVGVKAVQEVVTAKAYYGCRKAMVFTTGTYTNQAYELAQYNRVTLRILRC